MNASDIVRVAVVGSGNMGANHARVYASLKGVELVAVVDSDRNRAESVVAQYGGRALTTVAELAGLVDACTVAVPSSLHLPVGLELLELGIDCLIEKPLAVTVEDGRQLVTAAEHLGRVLLVGHIEQFNPAVEQLTRILRGSGERIIALDARRMSAVSSRIVDVDVVADLMIHDIEVALHMVDADVVDVTARGIDDPESGGLAYVTGLVSIEGGALASLTASRVTQNQIRELHVTTDERLFVVDYSAQELKIYRQGRIGMLDPAELTDGQYVLDVGMERVFVRRSEPLASELSHFIDCVRGQDEPRVTGSRALRALEIASRISMIARG